MELPEQFPEHCGEPNCPQCSNLSKPSKAQDSYIEELLEIIKDMQNPDSKTAYAKGWWDGIEEYKTKNARPELPSLEEIEKIVISSIVGRGIECKDPRSITPIEIRMALTDMSNHIATEILQLLEKKENANGK